MVRDSGATDPPQRTRDEELAELAALQRLGRLSWEDYEARKARLGQPPVQVSSRGLPPRQPARVRVCQTEPRLRARQLPNRQQFQGLLYLAAFIVVAIIVVPHIVGGGGKPSTPASRAARTPATALTWAEVQKLGRVGLEYAATLNTTVAADTNSSPLPAPLGVSLATAEAHFYLYAGSANVHFKAGHLAGGAPRFLADDTKLDSIMEIDGDPVFAVSIVSFLDISNKSTLESQVIIDALPCLSYGGKVASKWCASRILNTNSNGLITASATKQFGKRLWVQVKTYHPTSATPPMVSVELAASKYGLTYG